MSFQDKVVVVTGGARGIGKGIAEAFHKEGASLAILGRNAEVGEAVASEMGASGSPVKFFACDISSAEDIDKTVDAIYKEFDRIDVVVNNAGITKDGILMRMKDDAWDAVINTNLTGAFRLTRAVARKMLKARSGAIVNISSVIGISGNAGQANYAASKAGLIGLTKSAAKEFGPRGVRVNAVAPGLIETDMVSEMTDEQREAFIGNLPLGRTGNAEDVANVVLFLASDKASYVTGQTLNVCGGYVI